MKFGMSIRNMDKFANFDDLIALATDAEDAGWDGIFLWDHILHRSSIRRNIIDTWIALAAIAANTRKIHLGPMITPPARRRPWKLAKEAVTLDHLAKGRLILGVGLGWPRTDDFERFGDSGDDKIRGEKLDEALDILQGLWTGKPFTYQGKHYYIAPDTVFLPKPYNKHGIPIWIGGGSWPRRKKPFRRAAKYQGCTPEYHHKDSKRLAAQYSQIAEYINKYRKTLDGYDFAAMGIAPKKPDKLKAYFSPIQQAGTVTWWIEKVYSWPGNVEAIKKRLRKGPPTLP
jgi:hypothetical protein